MLATVRCTQATSAEARRPLRPRPGGIVEYLAGLLFSGLITLFSGTIAMTNSHARYEMGCTYPTVEALELRSRRRLISNIFELR